MAKIGICLATCNGASFLKPQLDSIAAQTFADWHLYVRDDASCDGTVEILVAFAAQYPGRVTILTDGDGRLGARANFARVMSQTSEPYVAFADQDDVWRPLKLFRALNALQRLEERYGGDLPAMVHADRRVIDATGREIARSYWASRQVEADAIDLGTCLSFCLAAGATMLVNRALLGAAGPVPETARMYDTWLELVAHGLGVVAALDDIALDWRRHGNNVSGEAGDNSGVAARRFWARARRLLGARDLQGAIADGYLVQAAAFRAQFGDRLTASDRSCIDAFLALAGRGSVERLLLLLRHRIGPPGLLRRVVFAAHVRGMPFGAGNGP